MYFENPLLTGCCLSCGLLELASPSHLERGFIDGLHCVAGFLEIFVLICFIMPYFPIQLIKLILFFL